MGVGTVRHSADRPPCAEPAVRITRARALRTLAQLDRLLAGAPAPVDAALALLGATLGERVVLRAADALPQGTRVPVAVPGAAPCWLGCERRLGDLAVELLAQAALSLGLVLGSAEDVRGIRREHAAAVLDDLRAGLRARAATAAQSLGASLQPPLVVAFVVSVDHRLVAVLERELEGTLLIEDDGGVVAIGGGEVAERLECGLRDHPALRDLDVGVAWADALDQVPAALAAARTGARRRSSGDPAAGVDPEVVRFAERMLDPVLAHDRARDSDLTATLRAYLNEGGNVAAAARRLDVHVNTLRHRLARVAELGVDLRDPSTRFGVDLALRLTERPPRIA